MTHSTRCWYFNQRPEGALDDQTMALRETPVPELTDGQILLRPIYISMDATNRLWLTELDIYMDTIKLGEPMQGFTLAQIEQSRHPDFAEGSLVTGLGPWAELHVSDGAGWAPFPQVPNMDLAKAFGIFAIAGPTACIGMQEIGQAKAGDNVVVTAAAGAVGSVAGQIAKLLGCHVVGVAGSTEKCQSLTDDFGFDAAVNYKSDNVVEALRAKLPGGIDLHYENVGGAVLDAGLTLMNNYGRVVICGLISTYGSNGPVPGPYMFRNVIMRRLRIEGFVVLDYLDRYPEYHERLLGWMDDGKIAFPTHVLDGMEQAPQALQMLFTGENHGKLMVRFGADSG